MGYVENGTKIDVLKEAETDKADLFIAVTRKG